MHTDETTDPTDEEVTRLALALHEADERERRKRDALAQAVQEVGVSPHYLELAREQLRKSRATQQQSADHGLPRSRVTAILIACFALLGLLLFPLVLYRRMMAPSPLPPEPKPETIQAIQDLKLDNYVPLENLHQLNSGPGVLVFAPILKKPDNSVREFTEGMQRWLQLIVGGHAEMGRTPLWTPTDRAWMHYLGVHVQPLDEAVRAHQYLGVTHVIVGEMSEENQSYHLSYRIYQTPNKAPAGSAITANGSLEEIRRAMPRLAEEMLHALGVTNPRVPAAVGETVEELEMLGRIDWIPGQLGPQFFADDLVKLRNMATTALSKNPPEPRDHPPLLGAFLYLIHCGSLRDGPGVNELVPPPAKAMPDNGIVFGEIGRQMHWARRWNRICYPSNAWRNSNSSIRTTTSSGRRKRTSTRSAVIARPRALPLSTLAPVPWTAQGWMHLDDIITEQGMQIRQGRVIADMSPLELKVSKALYGEELKAARETVRIDPTFGVGWRHVSFAAGFIGNGKEADDALWKCIALRPAVAPGPHPEDCRIYWWGLEMYQKKWDQDPAKLEKVALLAIQRADRWTGQEREWAAESLVDAGKLDLARKLPRSQAESATLEACIKANQQPEKDATQ